MFLLVLLAVLAIVAFGVGFTLHSLFIVAAVLALVWLISLFTGAAGGCGRSAWWSAPDGFTSRQLTNE